MAVKEKLTLKQRRFAKAYVQEANGAEAVVLAGYKVKDRQSAAVVASENLSKPKIIAEVESWQARLERNIVPSLQVIEEIRDKAEDQRLRLAASRDLLNRAGVGKQSEGKTSVVAVFANMDEAKLLDKMAQLAGVNMAKASEKVDDVSHNIDCATQADAEAGTGVRLPAAEEKSSPS